MVHFLRLYIILSVLKYNFIAITKELCAQRTQIAGHRTEEWPTQQTQNIFITFVQRRPNFVFAGL